MVFLFSLCHVNILCKIVGLMQFMVYNISGGTFRSKGSTILGKINDSFRQSQSKENVVITGCEGGSSTADKSSGINVTSLSVTEADSDDVDGTFSPSRSFFLLLF